MAGELDTGGDANPNPMASIHTHYALCVLSRVEQPPAGAGARDVVRALRDATMAPGSSPPFGCLLGVRVTEFAVVLICPIEEGQAEWEQRTGGVRHADGAPECEVCRNHNELTDCAFLHWARERAVVRYKAIAVPDYLGDETTGLPPLFAEYSEEELITLIGPLAAFGYAWCKEAGTDGPFIAKGPLIANVLGPQKT